MVRPLRWQGLLNYTLSDLTKFMIWKVWDCRPKASDVARPKASDFAGCLRWKSHCKSSDMKRLLGWQGLETTTRPKLCGLPWPGDRWGDASVSGWRSCCTTRRCGPPPPGSPGQGRVLAARAALQETTVFQLWQLALQHCLCNFVFGHWTCVFTQRKNTYVF